VRALVLLKTPERMLPNVGGVFTGLCHRARTTLSALVVACRVGRRVDHHAPTSGRARLADARKQSSLFHCNRYAYWRESGRHLKARPPAGATLLASKGVLLSKQVLPHTIPMLISHPFKDGRPEGRPPLSTRQIALAIVRRTVWSRYGCVP
jgi:hypothetical protein